MLNMNFVDRIEETARLRDALSREKSSLVVVYGRRRLGNCETDGSSSNESWS